MTTIAFDGKTLACDSRHRSGDDIRHIPHDKVAKVGDLYVVAAGSVDALLEFRRWVQDGADLEKYPAICKDDEHGMVGATVDADGVVSEYAYRGLPRYQGTTRCYAMGSGSSYALGAMEAGADAAKAVEIACRYDSGSGLPVKSYPIARLKMEVLTSGAATVISGDP